MASMDNESESYHALKSSHTSDTRMCDLAQDCEHSQSAVVELAQLDSHPVGVIRVLNPRTHTYVITRLEVGRVLGDGIRSILKEADEGDDLNCSQGRHFPESLDRVGGELSVEKGMKSFLHEKAKNTQHRHTTVFQL